MTDEEAYKLLLEPPENSGFENEIRSSDVGKYEIK